MPPASRSSTTSSISLYLLPYKSLYIHQALIVAVTNYPPRSLKPLQKWLWMSLAMGLGWSLPVALLLNHLPLVERLESYMRDWRLRSRPARVAVGEIPLQVIDLNSVKFQNMEDSRYRYCQLVTYLLEEARVKVVALNLPTTFVIAMSSADSCLQDLIARYPNRLVLIAYTNSLRTQSSPSPLPLYNHLLPIDERTMKPLVAIDQIQGFFEYYPDPQFPPALTSPARSMCLKGKFMGAGISKTQQFQSFAPLVVQKFGYSPSSVLPSLLIPHFWGRSGTFSSVSIDQLCPEGEGCGAERHLRQSLYQKIALIGLTRPEDQYESPFAMPSPWGEPMSAVEIQANLLAGLLTQTYYRTPPHSFIVALLSLGTLALSGAIAWRFFGSRTTHILSSGVIVLCFGGYLGLAMLGLERGWLLPVVHPMLLWGLTGIALSVSLVSWQRRQWLAAQLQELDQLKIVERQASVFHAQKLLERVATDVHDGPLQELKLVMDRLEELQCHHRLSEIDPIIDQIERIGHSLREQLNDTCKLAHKLEITPQLRAGLDIGIRSCLQEFIRSGELKLRVVDNLKPLREPHLNSDWIAAREDILRFAREAIANIVHHAQPPHGTATQVIATLNQQGSLGILTLENDSFQPLDHLLRKNQPNRGGYGTKVMETIASSLPDGRWHREWLSEGGMRVSLEWNLSAFTGTQSSTERPLFSYER